jgi:hypothetical protein
LQFLKPFFDSHVSVTGFFVISGFLITYLLFEEKEKFGKIEINTKQRTTAYKAGVDNPNDPKYKEEQYKITRDWYINKIGGIEEYERRKKERIIQSFNLRDKDKYRRAFQDLMRTVKKGGSDIHSIFLYNQCLSNQ